MRSTAATALVLALAALGGCGGSSEPRDAEGDQGRATTFTAPQRTARAPDPPATAPPARTEPEPPAVERPPIVQRPIPFPAKRRAEMAAYAMRHYGIDSHRLREPRVIVEHVSVTPDFESTYNAFAPDVPDPELRELPGVCSHFVVDRDGTIYQLVPLATMCRHTVGLNHTSIGIEHVGRTDAEVLGNGRQLAASLRLTHWLRCRHGIALGDVIGHAESLSSPHHRENVARLRTQTHGDMVRASMDGYRSKLRRRGGCS